MAGPIQLTTLANARLITLGSSGMTTYDALLTLLVNRISRLVEGVLGRKLEFNPSIVETIAPTSRQILLLHEWPIINIASVVAGSVEGGGGYIMKFGTDFFCDVIQDAPRGALYAEMGWTPINLVTGISNDVMAAVRSVVVTYSAGYLTPPDAGYIEGQDATYSDPTNMQTNTPGSLPLDIQEVVDEEIAEKFNKITAGAFGTQVTREGQVMQNWRDPSVTESLGISDEHMIVLNHYKRNVIA